MSSESCITNPGLSSISCTTRSWLYIKCTMLTWMAMSVGNGMPVWRMASNRSMLPSSCTYRSRRRSMLALATSLSSGDSLSCSTTRYSSMSARSISRFVFSWSITRHDLNSPTHAWRRPMSVAVAGGRPCSSARTTASSSRSIGHTTASSACSSGPTRWRTCIGRRNTMYAETTYRSACRGGGMRARCATRVRSSCRGSRTAARRCTRSWNGVDRCESTVNLSSAYRPAIARVVRWEKSLRHRFWIVRAAVCMWWAAV